MAINVYKAPSSADAAPDVPPWNWLALDAAGGRVLPSTLTGPPLGVALGAWLPDQSVACVRLVRNGDLPVSEQPRVVQRELEPVWSDDQSASRCWRRFLFAFPREGSRWAAEVSLDLVGGVGIEASAVDLEDMCVEERTNFGHAWTAAAVMVRDRASDAPMEVQARATRMLSGYIYDRPHASDPWTQSGAAGLLSDYGRWA